MYTHVFEITPDDNNGVAADAFMVGGDGEVTILPSSSSIEVTIPVVEGSIYPIAIRKVFSTGTTVSGVFGLV